MSEEIKTDELREVKQSVDKVREIMESVPGQFKTYDEKFAALTGVQKEMVEKHRGKIWVESEAGKRTDFKFTMPGRRPLAIDEASNSIL